MSSVSWVVGGLWCPVKIYCLSVEQMMIEIRQLGWEGSALAFLALCKVGFVSGFCAPFKCAKNSVGQHGKVMGV